MAFAGEGEDLMIKLDSVTFLSTILKSLGDPICMDVGSADGDNNNGNNGKGKRLVSDEEATISEEKRSNMCNEYNFLLATFYASVSTAHPHQKLTINLHFLPTVVLVV